MIKELRKKNMMCIFMCLFLMLAGGMLLCGCQKEQTESAVSTEEVKLEQGQYFVYGQIVSINGNEITYYVTEEETKEEIEQSEGGERPAMPEGGFNGAMSEGFEGGERPPMPEGGFNGEMPWGNNEADSVREEETVTVQIPVGTKVTTRLGTETTFSRLAAGDNIKMLIQENDGQEEIMEIWIVD